MAAGEVRSSAAVMLVADWASMGSTGRPTCSLNALSPATPSRNAASATARRSPLSMTARRTSPIGIWVAFASASSTIPSWAPWRSSPISSRTRNPCSGSRGSGEEGGELLASFGL